MTDKQFEKMFPTGKSLQLGQRYRNLNHLGASEGTKERFQFKIYRLQGYLHEKVFADENEFLDFWNGHRGYVELAMTCDRDGAFFRDWMWTTRNSLAIKACIVNLHACIFGGARHDVAWDEGAEVRELLDAVQGLNGTGVAIALDLRGQALTPNLLRGLVHAGRADALSVLRDRSPEQVKPDDVAECLFRMKMRCLFMWRMVEFLEVVRPGLMAEKISSYVVQSASGRF